MKVGDGMVTVLAAFAATVGLAWRPVEAAGRLDTKKMRLAGVLCTFARLRERHADLYIAARFLNVTEDPVWRVLLVVKRCLPDWTSALQQAQEG